MFSDAALLHLLLLCSLQLVLLLCPPICLEIILYHSHSQERCKSDSFNNRRVSLFPIISSYHRCQCQTFPFLTGWSLAIIFDSVLVTQLWTCFCCTRSLSNGWRPSISSKRLGLSPWTYLWHSTQSGVLVCLPSSLPAASKATFWDFWLALLTLSTCCHQWNSLYPSLQWRLKFPKAVFWA